MTCSLCERPHSAHGFCGMHLYRLRRFGSTDKPTGPSESERFWSRVKRGAGCWIYGSGAGYGRVKCRGRQESSHRVAWILTHGQIPDGLIVRHKCDNPPCVRPDHLLLGTYQDNTNDAKARRRIQAGASAPSAKLTEDQARLALALRSQGLTIQAIADLFGVCRATISHLCSGRNWRVLRETPAQMALSL